MLYLIVGLAMASNPLSIRNFPVGVQELSKAIKDEDKRFRRYAARTLKGDIRRAITDLNSSDIIKQLEARQILGDFEIYTVPACITQIETKDVGPSCAVILGHLESGEAYDAINKAFLNKDLKYWHKRKLSFALSKLEAS